MARMTPQPFQKKAVKSLIKMGDGPEITSPSDKETKLDNLKPLIRVIDDDYAMRRSWAFLIEGEGWEVVTYSNALAFLAANDFSRPGCLLLDVRMPRMSGLELQNALKDKGVDLPIIFISGHGDIDMAEAIRLYRRYCPDHAESIPIRVDHVPRLAGEQAGVAGYDTLGRLFAIGYLKGLLQAGELN